MLSRAFRNRFVELHFDELPSQELEVILHQRCRLPLSYAKKLVSIMLALQVCVIKEEVIYKGQPLTVRETLLNQWPLLNKL